MRLMSVSKLLRRLLVLGSLGISAVPIYASGSRSVDADSFKSSDHTKTYSLPAASDTLVGRTSTDTLTGKTISGASNTLQQLPIGANEVQEVPSGTINGSNVTFTLANTPPANSTVTLFLDGMIEFQGGGLDYTISGATITMVTAPATGQTLYAFYSKY